VHDSCRCMVYAYAELIIAVNNLVLKRFSSVGRISLLG